MRMTKIKEIYLFDGYESDRQSIDSDVIVPERPEQARIKKHEYMCLMCGITALAIVVTALVIFLHQH